MKILPWIKLVSFVTILMLPLHMSYAACSCGGDGGDTTHTDQSRRNTEDPE